MTDGKQARSDVEALKPYEELFEESKILLNILDLIDIYGGEISEYLENGTPQELTDFRKDLNKTSAALTAEFTHLIDRLVTTDEIPEIISLLTNLFRRVNRAYLTSVASGCLCEACIDYCVDTDIAHQQMDKVLSDPVTRDYNPEKAVTVFIDGINSMNAHLLEHLEPAL
jgi:hypothetical protein